MKYRSVIFLLTLLAAPCGAASIPAPAASAAPAAPAALTNEIPLREFYELQWQRWLREDPTLATSVGDTRYNDRWPDLSMAALKRNDDADLAALAHLRIIDPRSLSSGDALTYGIVKVQFERRTALAPYKPYVYWISQLGSVQNLAGLQTANEIAEISPFVSVKNYEDWIDRLRAFGVCADQSIELLRIGVREHRTQPRVIMERVRPQITAQRVARPDLSPFFAPFKHMPPSFSSVDRDRLVAAGSAAIANVVLPAFARFDAFFNRTYLPASRSSIGVADTTDGAAYYTALIAYHTTTPLSADEIHRIGLTEVARIHGEMEKIIAAVGFNGSFAEFSHYLRTDPKFFYSDSLELLHAYMVIAKTIDPNLVNLFGKLPRTPYGVRAIPDTSAPSSTTAYYQPLSNDCTRPGFYYVNLYKPEARPKWEMEVLTSHEAVPGHHLQTALQFENAADVPTIRRMADFTAYVEGWALYAESLGSEVGLYTDPYSKFGQLTYEMWRAVRLVVDIGIHTQGWSRQQAIDYFTANAPKSELDIVNEIDRYIAWPGQALAYKIGQMKFTTLRERAREQLGNQFDIREFHDVVLSTGAVPLSVLDKTVQDWISSKLAKRARTATP